MGRSRLPRGKAKEKRIPVRVSPEDHRRYERAAHELGLVLSEVARDAWEAMVARAGRKR